MLIAIFQSVSELLMITFVISAENNMIKVRQGFTVAIISQDAIALLGGVKKTLYRCATDAISGLVAIQQIAGHGY